MIDLRETMLPNAIEVDGVTYRVKTDFRTWIRFWAEYEDGTASYCIFDGDIPPGGDWEASAVLFLTNPNVTPRGSESPVRLMDYILDGEYIVASFQAAYGIDLTDPNLKMHWHRFKALMDGLPDDSKMAKIIGYRGYNPSNKKHETLMREQQQSWRLPEKGELEEMAEARSIAEILYERQNNG